MSKRLTALLTLPPSEVTGSDLKEIWGECQAIVTNITRQIRLRESLIKDARARIKSSGDNPEYHAQQAKKIDGWTADIFLLEQVRDNR